MVIATVGQSRAQFPESFGDDRSVEGLRLDRLELFEGEDRIWAFCNRLEAGRAARLAAAPERIGFRWRSRSA